MKIATKLLIPILILGLIGCESGSQPSGKDVVAMAAGFELDAQTAAGILAPNVDLPNQPEVARALADLWVQYYMLARAAAEDTTLQNLDLSLLVDRQTEGELLGQLREVVIQVDTAFSDEELRRRFEDELPGGKVRARHILLQFPERASEAQVDSVRALAESLRSRLLEGESFEELAREFSQDAGTAVNGGDLGSFGKSEMVPPFEASAFSLKEGEISEVTETTYGLHLIRVEERIIPPFDEAQEQFRTQLKNQAVLAAESTFVAGLMERAQLEPDSSGFETMRQLASNPEMDLSPRALDRSLILYDGGSFTLGEFRDWLMTGPPNVPSQVEGATDDQLENLLTGLTRSEILVAEARSEGLEIPAERRDSMAAGILTGVKNIAQELGFLELEPEEGETVEAAADRAVRGILAEIVVGSREAYQLQTVTYALKDQFGARVFEEGVSEVVRLVTQLRAQTQTTPAAPPTAPPDTLRPDTAGPQG